MLIHLLQCHVRRWMQVYVPEGKHDEMLVFQESMYTQWFVAAVIFDSRNWIGYQYDVQLLEIKN